MAKKKCQEIHEVRLVRIPYCRLTLQREKTYFITKTIIMQNLRHCKKIQELHLWVDTESCINHRKQVKLNFM